MGSQYPRGRGKLISVSWSLPACSTWYATRQLLLHSETLSQNTNKQATKNNLRTFKI